MIYCGIDWAERTHDVALGDDDGQLLAKRRITDDASGNQLALDLLAEHGDTAESPIPVAIETGRGLLVAVLRASERRKVFAINPMAAARYRDRHGVSRKKSDPGDALVLANILRTDMPMHRPMPADTELARAIAVLARAQQDATWNRQRLSNQLRPPAPRVPSRRPRRLRTLAERPLPTRGPRAPASGTHPGPSRASDPQLDRRRPQAGRPQPQARRHLPGRRRARPGRRGTLPPAPRRGDPAVLPRPGCSARRPRPGRGR